MIPVIRYIGAYGKAKSLIDSLRYEWQRSDEVAATTSESARDCIEHAGVAIMFKKSSIIKRHKGDVWSKYGEDGKLYATRRAVKTHREFWVRAGSNYITGVVITKKISKTAFETCRDFCCEKGIPLFVFTKKGPYKQVMLPVYRF